MPETNNRFGETVRRLREQGRMTQQELGVAADIAAWYVYQLERGEWEPPNEPAILRLSAALGVHSDDLMAAACKLPSDLIPLLGRPGVIRILRTLSYYTDDELGHLEATV